MLLYLDTSTYLSLGLFQQGRWIELRTLREEKNSTQLHALLYQLLQAHHVDVSEIKEVLHSSGPGSYTGMRVSQGVVDILALFKVAIFSFHHFDLPGLLGQEKGRWIARAFKGEYFIHTWDANQLRQQELIKERDLLAYLEGATATDQECVPLYTHYRDCLGALATDLEKFNVQETAELVATQGLRVVEAVKADPLARERKPFYFRALEAEFRPFRPA